MRKFIIFSVTLFLIILAAGGMTFIFSMQQIIKTSKSNELVQMLEIERIKLENAVKSEIAIVLKLANSPLIRRYFLNPGNPELEKLAVEEIASYREAFSEYAIFWINDIDRVFYSDDNESYWVDAEDPINYWYNMTLFETESYNFNINYNPEMKQIKVWINAPVFDRAGSQRTESPSVPRPIGMVGTGIELTTFVNIIYENINDGTELCFFNTKGEITGARNIELVSEKRIILEEPVNYGIDILDKAFGLQPGETQTFSVPSGKIAIGTVPVLEWYSFAFIPVNITDYNVTMTLLFLMIMVIILIIIIIFNVFISRFLRSLHITMESLKIASKAKGDFLAKMSHELRTPMNAVIGMAIIGKKAEDIDRKHYALNRIEDASHHLLGVINDVLEMSKIEANKLELSHIDFELNHSLHKAVSLLQHVMEEKQIHFSMNVKDKTPSHFFGDDQRLTQVITNLLSNAVKFTPRDGKIELTVSLEREENIGELRFEIADTGIGMTAEQQERLFKEFEQAESGTTRKFGGTGLGLVISKHIIELMGGSIWVESEYGKGTSFIFTIKLPISTSNSDESGFENDDEITAEELYGALNGKNILVVDDIDINREIVISMLDGTGVIIDTADNGKAAFDLIISSPDKYDLIFMDIQMPVMDGYEASRQIRSFTQTRNRKLPIIAMTASIFQEDIDKCHAAGMDGHVGKPLDLSAVLKELCVLRNAA